MSVRRFIAFLCDYTSIMYFEEDCRGKMHSHHITITLNIVEMNHHSMLTLSICLEVVFATFCTIWLFFLFSSFCTIRKKVSRSNTQWVSRDLMVYILEDRISVSSFVTILPKKCISSPTFIYSITYISRNS